MNYITYIKRWKTINKGMKKAMVADLIRNGLFMLLAPVLYLLFRDTGLIVYLILMIKYHWWSNEKAS